MALDKRDLYRLPWSKNDNPIAWLEVTDLCNLRCEGCYRQALSGHKTLEEIREEIRFFKRWRNPDNVSIAGGEPLLHPDIVEVVAFIAQNKIKPVLLTNAARLTPQLLRELKRAGLSGFTLHVDSHQHRPDWEDADEVALNELRQRYADLIATAGELITVFNATVYPSTFQQVPDVVRWGQANLDRVHGLVFITYRTLATDTHQAVDVAGQQVDAGQLGYSSEHFDQAFVTGPQICELIAEHFPQVQVSGYLGGTVRHDSFKWLTGAVLGAKGRVYGSVGKQTMELAQVGHHLLRGTYLAYLSQLGIAPLAVLMSPWDQTVRRAAGNWLSDLLRHPERLLNGLQIQTIGIIQAPDLQASGQVDMCDSCPDMTVWNGNLINSCRMDEYRLFGGLLSATEREQASTAPDRLLSTPDLAATGGRHEPNGGEGLNA